MISVVIPTLDEEDRLPTLLAGLAHQDSEHEVIVVDGGSRDDTVGRAEAAGVRVLSCGAGRGAQLRHGAAAARGDVLLFLHADSRLADGALATVERALAATPRAVGGNFRLLFDGGTAFDRWLIGFYAWIRSHGLYYGDSGIFVRRSAYQALGGIRALAVMEDYDFVRRLERHGRTVCIDAPPLVTSSRRFAGRHPVAIVLGWLWMHALYHLGMSPARLARLYDSERAREARR